MEQKLPVWAKESLINAIMGTGYYSSNDEAVNELEAAYENLKYDSGGCEPSMRLIRVCMDEANLDLDHVTDFLFGYFEYLQENPFEEEEDSDFAC